MNLLSTGVEVLRSWQEYSAQYQFRQIILFSGHDGAHSRTYGTTQGQENYMIDRSKAAKPDVVLDANDPRQLDYFPANAVSQIVADDGRFLDDEVIPCYQRILKEGGSLIFKPGMGLGWPELSPTDEIRFGETGRYASVPLSLFDEITFKKNQKTKESFVKQALSVATKFYGKMGFSCVSYNERFGVFVLTK